MPTHPWFSVMRKIAMRQLLPVGLFGSFIICAMVPLTVAEEPSGAEKNIVDLYKTDKLFDKSQHKVVRAAFSQLFAEKHKERIKKAFGDDNEKLTEWLEARPDVKEDFYTALDERHDNLDAALSLFHAIWSKFPDQVEPFANVAIAIAVTWDQDRGPVYGGVVYDYSHHQVRTRSKLPGGFTDALANFSYIVEEEKKFDVRTRYLPWEFLVFVVDHRTPVEERKWAQGYFQLAKNRVKSMHQDVPYDHDMLKGERDKGSGSKPHLDGELYTLKNIRSLGGVCANQADFACRVGKSVCIPSVYCWGESSYRGLHAWSMYVNVKKATKEKIDFTLVSDGRLVGFIMDAFYTGKVIDPKSGQEMMDRDMERRLWVAGTDRAGKRQTDLIMRAYPWLC